MTRLLLVALIAAAVCVASAGVGAAATTWYAEEGESIWAVNEGVDPFYGRNIMLSPLVSSVCPSGNDAPLSVAKVSSSSSKIAVYSDYLSISDTSSSGLSAYANALRAQGHTVEQIYDPITSSKLDGCEALLMIGLGRYLSSTEKSAIEDFVENQDKGLLISGGSRSAVNDLAQGFTGGSMEWFGSNIVCDPTDYEVYPKWVKIQTFYDHPITENLDRIIMYKGTNVPAAWAFGGIIGCAYSDEDSWLDEDGDYVYDAGESRGTQPVLAYSSWDKIVIVPDTNVFDNSDADGDGVVAFYEYDNDVLGLNVASWLAAAEEGDVKIKGGVTDIWYPISFPPIYTIDIDEVIEDPLNKFHGVDEILVSYDWGTPAEIDSGIGIRDNVEVYGAYCEGGYDIILTESEHYLKRIEGPVYNIDTGESFTKIQDAINDYNTLNGHTIKVNHGTYTENIDVTKSLTIESTSGTPADTIVQAAVLNQDVFAITADNVEISGLTIEGASDWSGDWPAGIYLNGVCGCTITKNTISNNVANIILNQSSGNTITKNTISYSLDHSILSSWSDNDNNIYLNNFKSNTYLPGTVNVTWNSTSKISYTYQGNAYTNYLGNYWDDYDGSDADGDGIGETSYDMYGDEDNHPLVEPFENYTTDEDAVKFRGIVENEPSGPYDIEVRIDEVLMDPEDKLSIGDLAQVDIADDPSECEVDWPLYKGDSVEVCAKHYEYDCWQGYYAVCAWIYPRDNPNGGYIVRAQKRIIKFAGHNWTVRSEWGGPGNNFWSNSEENVWVDEEGLHLKIVNRSGMWYCAEIDSTDSFGYGKYTLYLDGRPDLFDKNVVLGLFTYLDIDGDDKIEVDEGDGEIDIEFSKWGSVSSENNAQYVLQYHSPEGAYLPEVYPFHMTLNGYYSTHYFDWQSSSVHFKSIHGHYNNTNDPNLIIAEKTLDGNKVPTPSNEKVHINLWLVDGDDDGHGDTPSNNQEVEIIIKDFNFSRTEYNPKVSIPTCAPYWIRSYIGNTFTYMLKVQNNGTEQDTIDLTVDPKYNEGYIDYSLSEDSVTLNPSESKIVKLSVTPIKKTTEGGGWNKIIINATSEGNDSKISSCYVLYESPYSLESIHPLNFVLEFNNPDAHILSFVASDNVKIQETQWDKIYCTYDLNSSQTSSREFYVEVTDETLGEMLKIPNNLNSSFHITATDYHVWRDGYQFPNKWSNPTYKKGLCDGMSETSIIYHVYDKTNGKKGFKRPDGYKTTYSIPKEDAAPMIKYYHYNWNKWPIVLQCEYNFLKSYLESHNEPMLLTLIPENTEGDDKLMHAVVAYKIVESGDTSYIYIYDPNKAYQIGSDELPYAKFNLTTNEFEYGEYHKFFAQVAACVRPPKNMISDDCPINFTITDKYGRIISDNNGTDEIPDADMIIMNDTKIFYLPVGLAYSVDIDAYDTGTFNFTRVSPIGNDISITKFENIPITASTKAFVEIVPDVTNYTMSIDYEGDGVYETNITPDVNETIIMPTLRGDVNYDGNITPADAAIALRIAATGAHDDAADVSGDGRVTALDALMILQAAADAIDL